MSPDPGPHNEMTGEAAAVVQARDIHGDVHFHQGPPASPEAQVVVGLIPHEPPNFQPPDQVATLATMSGEVCVVCAVTGQRGVGKTQLAAAYARQRVRDGWLVAWINAETPDLIQAGMADLADRLHLRNPEDDADRAAARLRDHLQTRNAPALLTFDNLADLSVVIPYLPAAGPTQVVVTTTVRGAERMGRSVPVDVFDEDTALRFLRQATRLNDDEGARTLATELGRLPLALAQAAARIRAGWTYETYLDHHRRYPVERYLTSRPGDPYPLGAPAAILIALEPFYPSDLLDTLAVLSPDGVSRDILGADESVDDELEKLYEASIIEFAGGTTRVVTMHRLVQRIIRDRCHHAGTFARVVSRQTDRLRKLTFPVADSWRLRQRGDELVRQIDALWEYSANEVEITDLASQLRVRSWAVRHLTETAALLRAISLGRAVLSDIKTHLGDDHPDTLVSANRLGRAYRLARRLGEAIPLHERTLSDRRRVLGDDHPDTLVSANDLAAAYRLAGRLDEAISLYEQTVSDKARVLGDDHPSTLSSANNLAAAYRFAGRLGEAIPLHERTLSDRRRVLGDDHPSTLESANSLARAYRLAGRLGEAIPLHERTLSDRRRVLGDDHPDTLVSANDLAFAYQLAGRLDEAISLYEQTLTRALEVMDESHPWIATFRGNLQSCRDKQR